MESTGPYSYRLAETLAFAGKKVSVVNALKIKRFGQMSLSRTKTDASDAKKITEYAKTAALRPFIPLDDAKHSLKQLLTALEGLKSLRKSCADLIESIEFLPRVCEDALGILEHTLLLIEEKIAGLQKKIDGDTKRAYGETAENLLTIPGVGMGTISLLLTLTGGLESFNTSKELAAYVGICPGTHESGTSVRRRGAICRIGNGALRAKLYMCALSASKKNRACRNLYERLCANGKNRKLAMVAVAHKLLKQIFAIAKNGAIYEENYGLAA
jgi:transposase